MKPLFIISCPIDTYSGYGARSRDVVKSLIELNKYDIKVLPQRWGNCPWGFIKDHPEWDFLTPHLFPMGHQMKVKPDIWAQITVPNEFTPIGKYNIGFTAGMETTIVAPQWVEGINRMDINFVSSEHSKQGFINSKYEQKDNQGNLIRHIQIEKPIEVLFEGANLDLYQPKISEFNLDNIEENFAYLFVGHWLQGVYGEDRKNVGVMVKSFLEAFKNKRKAPALILKTSKGQASYLDREDILNSINEIKKTVKNARTLPNIYLLHGEISDKEVNELYNHKKVKAMVSLTKGEGFGRPLLEFSLTKKPIITTKWSGHLDFLDPKFTTLIAGDLTQVHDSAVVKDMILKESSWFSANPGEFMYYLRDMFENYKGYKEKANRQAYKSKTNFSFEQMTIRLENLLSTNIPEFTQQIPLNLPKLNLPKIKKLENV